MQETRVRSLGREDPLEKEMATHSSILAWRTPWMEEPGGLQSTGLQRVGHDWATSLSFFLSTLLSTYPLKYQFSSVAQLCPIFATVWTTAHQASLSITNSWSLPKLMSVELVMSSNHLILCHPLLLPPSIFPCNRVFSNESGFLIRWPKYWSFSFTISPSNEYSGLISFRIDWLDLLAVQGTQYKNLLQHHSSKGLILQHPAFFMVQFSYPYMTTRKTIALTRWTLLAK